MSSGQKICGYPCTTIATFALLVQLFLTSAIAQQPQWAAETDLYDRPTLAFDPGTHTASIWSQAVDHDGRFVVTGGADHTVRVWSVADGELRRTFWIPAGSGFAADHFQGRGRSEGQDGDGEVGQIFAVAISPDGTTVAAGGRTEHERGDHPIYVFERESGSLVRRIHGDLPEIVQFLTFSPSGRYLAATLRSTGLRIFDRENDWKEVFRDDDCKDRSYGAAFTPDNRLIVSCFDGLIRVYQYDSAANSPNFRRMVEPIKATAGNLPYRIAVSSDGKRLAIGYDDVPAVDILDGTTFERLDTKRPSGLQKRGSGYGLTEVAWSVDGQMLFAAGGAFDAENRNFFFTWGNGGIGVEERHNYCAQESASGVNALPNGTVLVASMAPCVSLLNARGEPVWTVASPVLDFSNYSSLKTSADGKVIDFGYGSAGTPEIRFNLGRLSQPMSSPPPDDKLTSAPELKSLPLELDNETETLKLAGHALAIEPLEHAKAYSIAPDAQRFYLGSSYGLTAFDASGARIWRRMSLDETFAVNATSNGKIVVAAYGDGTIRWHRADDGRELLALQVSPNKADWVLWTPEGFYAGDAANKLSWVVNHGLDEPATTFPVTAIPRLNREQVLPNVVDELETPFDIGDLSAARLRNSSQRPK